MRNAKDYDKSFKNLAESGIIVAIKVRGLTQKVR